MKAYKKITYLSTALTAMLISSFSHAISYGEPDNFRHPNVVSIRWVDSELDARISCTGSLMHVDDEKYVFLTAGHCSVGDLGGWESQSPEDGSVGVSFDEINANSGADGINYVTGGVSVTHPQYRFPGSSGNNDRFDQALVIIPIDAVNSFGQTIKQRWEHIPGALTPIQTLAPLGAVEELVADFTRPKNLDLVFTAVGFGTQSDKSQQGTGEGNQEKADILETFPIRHHTEVGYRKLNGYMIEVETKATQGEFGGICGGDSGSPLIYKDPNGAQLILGVLTMGAGNCRNWGGYSRIDYQEVIQFINCAYVPGNADDVLDCVDSLP